MKLTKKQLLHKLRTKSLKNDEPKTEEPKVETPVEPKVEEPKVEEPKVETPVEEPKTEEPKIETPVEEPKAEPKQSEDVIKLQETVNTLVENNTALNGKLDLVLDALAVLVESDLGPTEVATPEKTDDELASELQAVVEELAALG